MVIRTTINNDITLKTTSAIADATTTDATGAAAAAV